MATDDEEKFKSPSDFDDSEVCLGYRKAEERSVKRGKRRGERNQGEIERGRVEVERYYFPERQEEQALSAQLWVRPVA